MTINEKEELLAKIWDMPKPKDGSNYWQGVDDVADLISNMPITEREKGEWIPVYQGDEIIDYRCNKCDFGSTFGRGKHRFNFCSNCGADMRPEPYKSESEDKE